MSFTFPVRWLNYIYQTAIYILTTLGVTTCQLTLIKPLSMPVLLSSLSFTALALKTELRLKMWHKMLSSRLGNQPAKSPQPSARKARFQAGYAASLKTLLSTICESITKWLCLAIKPFQRKRLINITQRQTLSKLSVTTLLKPMWRMPSISSLRNIKKLSLCTTWITLAMKISLQSLVYQKAQLCLACSMPEKRCVAFSSNIGSTYVFTTLNPQPTSRSFFNARYNCFMGLRWICPHQTSSIITQVQPTFSPSSIRA